MAGFSAMQTIILALAFLLSATSAYADCRTLIPREHEVLAHVVLDPDAWWDHACTATNIVDPEAALRHKIARWTPDYDASKARDGQVYKNRAQRETR